jgi:hypothetical protein
MGLRQRKHRRFCRRWRATPAQIEWLIRLMELESAKSSYF